MLEQSPALKGRTFVKDIEQKNRFFFLIRSIISYFVCLATIIVTMFICFPIGLLSDLLASPRAHKAKLASL